MDWKSPFIRDTKIFLITYFNLKVTVCLLWINKLKILSFSYHEPYK